jgi:CheY-like chemotaxis protein
MPGTMDGIKLAHYIRDRRPPVNLIAASGAAIVEESILSHGSRFFTKPYDELAITVAMAHLLSSETQAPIPSEAFRRCRFEGDLIVRSHCMRSIDR